MAGKSPCVALPTARNGHTTDDVPHLDRHRTLGTTNHGDEGLVRRRTVRTVPRPAGLLRGVLV